MSEWRTEPLGACLEQLIDYRGRSPKKSNCGIPVLSAKVVKTDGLIFPIEQTISLDYYPQWMTRGLPQPGDVIMTTEAPMGEVIQLDEESARFALGQRIVCLRGKDGVLDNTFLRYRLISPQQQAILTSYATGTTVVGISQKALRAMPISLPCIRQQKQTVALLSALDKKIELNRRMNEMLEAMAQAIFRDWFVDFGPTRRQLAGATDPVQIMGGLTPNPEKVATLAPLFPPTLAANGLPEGWEEVASEELIEFNPKEPLRRGDVAPYTDMASLPTKGGSAEPPVDRPFGSGMRFRNGDALLARITPCLENGKAAYVDFLPDDDAVGWGSTEFIVLRSRAPVPPPFAYCLIRHPEFRDTAIRSMTGTSGRQRAQADTLKSFKLARASDDVFVAFGALIVPWFKMIRLNQEQNTTLTAMRDLLLPKLMSGEIRLRDAERAVAEAAT